MEMIDHRMKNRLVKIVRISAYGISLLSILFIGLAFTDLPYHAYHNLASVDEQVDGNPRSIIIMGGDGMPSPSGLMRCYFGAEMAKKYTQANIFIALPGDSADNDKQLHLMADELVIKGVDTNRILFLAEGFNTRSQALEFSEYQTDMNAGILVVTSPEHMFRAIATFERIGYTNVGGNPTFEIPNPEEDLKKDGSGWLEVDSLGLRYNVWSYMQYEIRVMREYVAIVYYWLMDWI